ncbi:MAG TPA: 16S rRNA (cytosine(1402)-N(4))-methyltransferase RsmH [Candidatus Bathyarchaeia archaeon]|nr:16S rRNA (cytosine(1402)-N(4))-methyltransferase RsmH [Candidatus Bathyarchaeia archaeon]
MIKFHEPVLVEETIRFLNVRKGKRYIDTTIGGGGHSEQILRKGGQVLGIDWDPQALAFSRKRLVSACPPSAFYWKLERGNFAHLNDLACRCGFNQVAGILFDLGVSLYQLKTSGRGFSFQDDDFLDMRMNPELGITASDLINHLSEKELKKLFSEFGQESFSAPIARAVCRYRKKKPIERSSDLAKIIRKVIPASRVKRTRHPATRCFQALRMVVNNELENLSQGLSQTLGLLEKGGRLVVISFHSLEDRLAKDFFRQESKLNNLIVLTKKPIEPSRLEREKNPRSRSAKLRAAQKN